MAVVGERMSKTSAWSLGPVLHSCRGGHQAVYVYRRLRTVPTAVYKSHTPSIIFRHLPLSGIFQFPAYSSFRRVPHSGIFLFPACSSFRHLSLSGVFLLPAFFSFRRVPPSGIFLFPACSSFRHFPLSGVFLRGGRMS